MDENKEKMGAALDGVNSTTGIRGKASESHGEAQEEASWSEMGKDGGLEQKAHAEAPEDSESKSGENDSGKKQVEAENSTSAALGSAAGAMGGAAGVSQPVQGIYGQKSKGSGGGLAKKMAILAGIVVILVGGALGAWLAFGGGGSESAENDVSVSETEEQEEEEEIEEDEDPDVEEDWGIDLNTETEEFAAVRQVVSEMKMALKEYFTTEDGKSLFKFSSSDAVYPIYQSDAMLTAAVLNKSVGFVGEYTSGVEADETLKYIAIEKRRSEAYANVYEGVFMQNGFVESSTRSYINLETGVVCIAPEDEVYGIKFGCGHTSWLDEDRLAFANELAKAVVDAGKAEYLKGSFISVNTDADMIQDSKIAPYQTLRANLVSMGMGGASALFYRVNPEAEWRFFALAQGFLPCDYYDTDDLRKAYVGTQCYYEDTMETDIVTP